MVKDNFMLATFVLNGITEAPKGQPKIAVSFEVDENYFLEVSAVELLDS